jgi:hypothetical protein
MVKTILSILLFIPVSAYGWGVIGIGSGTDDAVTYATWNPSDKNANITLSNGDLTVTAAGSGWISVRATQFKSSGKWYYEITIGTDNWSSFGVGSSSATLNDKCGFDAYGWGLVSYNSTKYHLNTPTASGVGQNLNDIIQIAFDLDNGKIWFGVNNAWSGDPSAGTGEAYSGLSGSLAPMMSTNVNLSTYTVNFGASAMAYAPPTGFNAGVFE